MPCPNPKDENAARWVSNTLLTITSNAFTELTLSFRMFYVASENQVRGWNLVDDVLDQHSLGEDTTLVVRSLDRVAEDKFEDLVGQCFPLMRGKGRVVLENMEGPRGSFQTRFAGAYVNSSAIAFK